MLLKHCDVERDGPLTVITIKRPEVLNALNSAAHFELAQVFDDFATDSSQWVAILTGHGPRAFSSGSDLKRQSTDGPTHYPPAGFGGLTRRFDLDKPVIAAVNGLALGGGFELVLACDIALGSTNASFGLPEPRVGLAALEGGLLRLPRQVPLKQAMGMVLTGRRIEASEALAMGLLNEVTTPELLMHRARAWAGSILECSPLAVRASKQAVIRGQREASIADAFAAQAESLAVAALRSSEDFAEGPRAFAEKRPPVWSGR